MFSIILKRRIYLDYASMTPIDPRVTHEMNKFSAVQFANPSSVYREGLLAKKTLEEGRKDVSDFIGAHPDEITFTGGGTEANNLAILGSFYSAKKKGIAKPHLIISAIEHSSIMETALYLEQSGAEVTRISVDKMGVVNLGELKAALKSSTFLVSVMSVNNEIGTIEPIYDIAKIIRQFRKNNEHINSSPSSAIHEYPLFHTDAAQAALYSDLNVQKLGVDLMTLDGSKVYGPRGIGALFVRRNTSLGPIVFGGGQENGMRSGTENIPAIMGFALALKIAGECREKESQRIRELGHAFFGQLKVIIPEVTLNGGDQSSVLTHQDKANQDFSNHAEGGEDYELKQRSGKEISRDKGMKKAPHILNVNIPGIDNEFFVLQLDAAGIACSTKSSCLRDSDQSYVLNAIGANSQTSVRFSFGRWTKNSHIRRALLAISALVC